MLNLNSLNEKSLVWFILNSSVDALLSFHVIGRDFLGVEGFRSRDEGFLSCFWQFADQILTARSAAVKEVGLCRFLCDSSSSYTL